VRIPEAAAEVVRNPAGVGVARSLLQAAPVVLRNPLAVEVVDSYSPAPEDSYSCSACPVEADNRLEWVRARSGR
jgi:hypothetical protein